mgnify:CR=1 FL=1
MEKLGEVCLINPKSCTLRDDTEVSFIPMTKVGEHGEFDASEIKNYSEVKKGFTNFQNGDILFAKITPCMENGKGAIAHNMKNGIGFGSTEFHVLRPDTDKITSEWLYYLTTWKTFRKEAERNMTGSAGQKRVPKTFLENYVVNLPDIDTQKSENKILRKVDDLIFLRKQQLAKLDELVKARFVEMFGDVSQKNALKNLCNFIDYRGKTPDKVDIGLPFITAKNVRMHYMSFDTQEFISKESYDKVMTRGIPRVGDVLFTTEAPLGNVCRIPQLNTEFYIGQRIITMQTDVLAPAYLEYALSSDDFKKELNKKSSGSTVTGIRSKLLAEMSIPVPPLSLQNDFAVFVEHVDRQKQTVQQSLEKLELMKKALMQEYFE